MVRNPQWARIEELYHAALALSSSERAAFLQSACAGDDVLRGEVESLLAQGAAEEFLATSALETAGREMAGSERILVGQRIGPYEILSLLGTGGMGEVYRARDARLQRDVAIKVLPAAVAHDPDRVSRFAREARLLAALNHPHIAAIHGVEEVEGVSALVLEFVDGQTLADRIARGPIPSPEALTIARQIVEGLEAAHGQGIIHRDLKPANIKLRPDGTVKILDFGLAKALAPARGLSETLPKRGSSATQVGVVTGTPAYMSPEQAQGQPVDKRTDIWAFGCVFYEMLTGTQAFSGETVGETLAAAIAAEPSWAVLPRDISPTIRAFLKRCLCKDVRRRLSDIGDMRLALEGAFDIDIVSVSDAAAGARPTPRWVALAVGAVVVVVLISGLAGWVGMRAALSPPQISRFPVPLPAGQRFISNFAHILAISPDGRAVTYAAGNALWLRPLNALEPTMIRGTERSEAHTPVFSPDGERIAFYAEADGQRQLMWVGVNGGLPVPIAKTERPFGATWGPQDRILYGRGPEGIWQVAVDGGTPEQVIAVAEGEEAHSPQVLPDETVLFTVRPLGASSWDDAQVVVQARNSTTRTVVVARGRDARYLRSGHLVYASNRDLLAAPFDLAAFRPAREPVSVLKGVQGSYLPFTDAGHFAVAGNGTLVYIPQFEVVSTGRRLMWVDRNGNEEPLPLELPGTGTGTSRVSPDGTRIVHNQAGNIFLSDVARPSMIPLRMDGNSFSPAWIDSMRIVFQFNGDPVSRLLSMRVDGTGEIESLATVEIGPVVSPGGWSPDRRRLVFTYGTTIQPRLGLLDLDRVGRDQRPWRPLSVRGTDASAASVSRDGRWIAYQSYGPQNKYHVYVERFPEGGDLKMVSTSQGGGGPVWSHDGRELFYRRVDDGAMMAVRIIETGAEFTFENPVVVVENNGWNSGPLPGQGGARTWDVAPDGRFLIVKTESSGVPSIPGSMVVVLNWTEDLKQLTSK